MKRLRPVLRYHGGKNLLAPWVKSQFPPHKTYCEPFCGAASVFMAKEPAYAEILNDLDGDVVNLFRVLRDPANAKDLENLLRLTPFARDEYNSAFEVCAEGDAVERARRLIVRSFMGFGTAASATQQKTGFRCNTHRTGTIPAHDWETYPNFIKAFVERLAGVLIENVPALTIINRVDAPDTLFYVDPPYPHSTRQDIRKGLPKQGYAHEMTDAEHRQLGAALRTVQGMVVLSGYACPLYDEEMFPDWARLTKTTYADGRKERTEVLWLNPAAQAGQQGRLF